MILKFFRTFNEKILRNTKQDSCVKIRALSIFKDMVKKKIRTKSGKEFDLEYPNKMVTFPLTNQFTNPIPSQSQQAIYMTIKQVGLLNKAADSKVVSRIDSKKDRSLSNIYQMGFLNTYNRGQTSQIDRIKQKFATYQEAVYNVEREVIFGQCRVNGEHTYLLRKYLNKPPTDFPQSKAMQEQFLNELFRAIQEQKLNQENLKKMNLSPQEFKQRIKSGDLAYSMLFEYLEQLTKGDILVHKPLIYLGNQEIRPQFYMQAPYPIFLKLKNGHFICAAIGFRYDQGKKVRFFSPFFQSQGQNVWRLAQSHLSQAIANDFGVRVHLGIYHFTTNQYNYPMYKFLKKLDGPKKQKYNSFLEYCYSRFNRGLQGVNTAATASLVHPIEECSLFNQTVNLNQSNVMKIIANYSNRVNMAKFNPVDLLESNGISRDELKNFDQAQLDSQLYNIISKYIDKIAEILEIKELLPGIMQEVNDATKKMKVADGSPRPGLSSEQDVLKLVKNLVFCWVGFHSHTFSNIIVGMYYHFRPTIVARPIPYDEKQWKNIKIGDEIPHTKILIENGKSIETTTQRDPDNFLSNIINNLYLRSKIEKIQSQNTQDLKQKQKAEKIQKLLKEIVQELENYGKRVEQVNARRSGHFQLYWLNPNVMQASLNV